MKKWGVLIALAMLMLLAGCQGQAANAPVAATAPQNTAQVQAAPEAAGEEKFDFENLPMVDITEKLFIAQCNDVYLNQIRKAARHITMLCVMAPAAAAPMVPRALSFCMTENRPKKMTGLRLSVQWRR